MKNKDNKKEKKVYQPTETVSHTKGNMRPTTVTPYDKYKIIRGKKKQR